MIAEVFPNKVQANDCITTENGKEIVFLVESFSNDTTILRFKSGRKLVCYSGELLQIIKSNKSFTNIVKHDRKFNR